MGSNPTEVKFSLTRGDSQISFKGVIPNGDLVYRQYCLLPAPKHTLKIIISYFPGATRIPYYISILFAEPPITATFLSFLWEEIFEEGLVVVEMARDAQSLATALPKATVISLKNKEG